MSNRNSIYSLTGSVMTVTSTPEQNYVLRTPTSSFSTSSFPRASAVPIPKLRYVIGPAGSVNQGGVYTVIPTEADQITLGTEIINSNTYYSGTEQIDNQLSRPVYMSKQNRLNFYTIYRQSSLSDLFDNIPDSPPSGSNGSKFLSGTVSTNPVLTTSGAFSFYYEAPTSASGDAVMLALSGNVVYFNSGSVSVTGVINGGTRTTDTLFVMNMIQSTSRSLEIPTGSYVSLLSTVPLSSSVSGVYLNRSVYNPTMIDIPVQVSGRIRALRTWVELLHDTRLSGSTGTFSGFGLQGTAISLRSPNTNFKSAHPLWNAASAEGLPVRTAAWASAYNSVPSLLQNSYLLWSGHMTEDGLWDNLNPTNYYHEYDHDIDMRTIFWDGSTVRNPRDLTPLFPSASNASPGTPLSYNSILGSNYLSPTQGAINRGVSLSQSLTGSVISWMSEFSNDIITSSLPAGWTDTNVSFVPTGANFGPETIKPVYSLLDTVYVVKMTEQSGSSGSFALPTSRAQILGSRPGLRDTEVSGTWTLMIGGASEFSSSVYVANSGSGVWFRQARMELIIDTGVGEFEFFPSRERKWKKSNLVPAADGFNRIAIVSGSSEWDIGLSYIQTLQTEEYGRTVSITTDKNATGYAVITYLTGALADRLTAEGLSGSNPTWYLGGNGFGTPYIPDSSMSLGNVSPEQIDAAASAELYKSTIGQTTLIPNANTMNDYLGRTGYSQTTEGRWVTSINSIYPTGSV